MSPPESFFAFAVAFGVLVPGCDGKEGGAGNPVTGTADGDKATCRDYSTKSAAQAAYDAGNRSLDGDADGIACE